MTNAVYDWWMILSVVATFNIAAWIISRSVLKRCVDRASSAWRRRSLLSMLSAGYVLGCAFRSFFPRIDLERICLVESTLSSMVIGRTVATVAELCFIAQCGLLLHQAGRGTKNMFTVVVSLMLVPLIVVAESASWYAILTTNYLGHVVENSIWTICALLLLASFAQLWPSSNRKQRHFLTAMIAFAIGYIAFMMLIDVPMYWIRWTADSASGAQYLTLAQGLLDASRPCVKNFQWDVWREEIPWMTLYFSVAVWVSISLAHAPTWVNGATTQQYGKRE